MERMEKASKRMQELETVTNNIQLLSDMLNHYSADTATSSELDVMKVRMTAVIYDEFIARCYIIYWRRQCFHLTHLILFLSEKIL